MRRKRVKTSVRERPALHFKYGEARLGVLTPVPVKKELILL